MGNNKGYKLYENEQITKEVLESLIVDDFVKINKPSKRYIFKVKSITPTYILLLRKQWGSWYYYILDKDTKCECSICLSDYYKFEMDVRGDDKDFRLCSTKTDLSHWEDMMQSIENGYVKIDNQFPIFAIEIKKNKSSNLERICNI